MKPLYFLLKRSKKRRFIYSVLQSLVVFLVMVGCSSDILDEAVTATQTKGETGLGGETGSTTENDKQIVMGAEMPDVYSVEAMREAYRQLYPNGDGQHGPDAIRTTHLYVRFLPKSDEEFYSIEHYDLSDIPLHLEIAQGGSSYHDPSIPEDQYTWQYAVIPVGTLNTTVQYEILKELYLIEESEAGNTGSVGAPGPAGGTQFSFWEQLEAASERIAAGQPIENNGQQRAPKREYCVPHGRIMAYDDKIGDYIPLAGVHVIVWHKEARKSHTITDADGYFRAEKQFRAGYGMYYRIKWTGGADYTIYDGPFLDQAYLCNGGMIWSDTWNVFIEPTDHKQKQLAAIFRAGERMYRKDYLGMAPSDLSGQIVIRYFEENAPGKQGSFRGAFSVFKLKPALRIWGKYYDDSGYLPTDKIFSTTSHELGHANHYYQMPKPRGSQFDDISQNIKESWADAVEYYITKKEYLDYKTFVDSYASLAPNNSGMPGRPSLLGIYDQPGLPGGGAGFITFTYPTDLNNQYWPYDNSACDSFAEKLEYSSLIIDLIDDNNQREYFKRKKQTGYIRLPNDNVKGFTLAEIQSVLKNVESVEDFKIKIKALNKDKHPTLNTDVQIDNLFKAHTDYWK